MELNTEEKVSLWVISPLKNHTAKAVVDQSIDVFYTFNPLWLDHSVAIGNAALSVEPWIDLRTAGIDSWSTAFIEPEINSKDLCGYHCQGLVGHLALTLGQGKMIRLNFHGNA